MPTTLTEDDEWLDVEVPAGGDQVSRADLIAAIVRLTNRTRWLMEHHLPVAVDVSARAHACELSSPRPCGARGVRAWASSSPSRCDR